jgi:hypothetical protein
VKDSRWPLNATKQARNKGCTTMVDLFSGIIPMLSIGGLVKDLQ